MKKGFALLFMALAVLTLSGCGEKEDVVTSSNCKLTQADGSKITINFSATNDEIDHVKMVMIPSNEAMNITTFEDYDETTKQQITDSFLTTMGFDKTSYKGFEIDVEYAKEMTITFDIDLESADNEALKKVGLDFENETYDMTLAKSVEEVEALGYTCD